MQESFDDIAEREQVSTSASSSDNHQTVKKNLANEVGEGMYIHPATIMSAEFG